MESQGTNRKRPYSYAHKEGTVQGFLHHISPVKMSRSNCHYFEATIQLDKESYSRVVCFDKTKHDSMTGASSAKTPVKWTNIKVIPSRLNSTEKDILVNFKNTVEIAKKLNFSSAENPASSSSRDDELQFINELATIPERNKVGISYLPVWPAL